MEHAMTCPLCGAWLDEDDVVYVTEEGGIAGCGSCLHEEYGWQRAAEMGMGGEAYGTGGAG